MAPQVFQSVRHPLKMYLSSSRVCLLVGYQMNDCLSYSYMFSLPSFLVCPPFVLLFGGIQSNSLNFNGETFKCIWFWVISCTTLELEFVSKDCIAHIDLNHLWLPFCSDQTWVNLFQLFNWTFHKFPRFFSN